jgi:hypothetical protein
VQESLTKIAQDHPASVAPDLAGSLVDRVKADDAKVRLSTPACSTFDLCLPRPSFKLF